MLPQTIQTLLLKADARFKIGRRDEAEPLLSRATDLYSRAGIYDNTFGKLCTIVHGCATVKETTMGLCN